MNGRTENAFLAELIRAMESDGSEVPSIEDVQNGELGSENMGRDPSGNPEGPGDDGDPAPNWGAEPEDNPHDVIDADDPSGNPDGPGDENGDPKDPATEAFGDSFKKWRDRRNLRAELSKKTAGQLLPEWENAAFINANYLYGDSAKALLEAAAQGMGGEIFDFYTDYKEHYNNGQGDGQPIPLKFKKINGPNGMSLWYGYYQGMGSLNDIDVWVMSNANLIKRMQCVLVDGHDMARDISRAVSATTPTAPPATESENISVDENDVPEGSFDDFLKNVNVANNTNLIELSGEKKPRTDDGTADDPGANADPSLQRGSPKPAPEEPQTAKGNDPSGNPDDPGVNGTPVLKGGSPSPLAKTEVERAADDPTGNPDSPGVDAKPDLGFESFIATCERSMISKSDGTIFIPQGMTLESYAMEIGLGEIVARALEADLTQAEKDKLPASAFGLPKERKWPLNDENHVRQAIRYFGRCPQEQQRELAKNILKAKRKFGMTDMKVGKNNPYRKYDPDLQVADAKPAKGKK